MRPEKPAMDTQAKIVEIIRRISAGNMTPAENESLFDTGVLDSFALVDVVAELEREFGITIPDSDLNPQTFASVSRIQAYVEKR
jgi:acyl carrier protein